MRKISDTIAFDLDGTLVDGPPHSAWETNDFEQMRKVTAKRHVIAYAKRLQQIGAKLVVITGRHEALRTLTKETVDSLGLGSLPLYMRNDGIFNLEKVAKEKAAHLILTGATLMVGDRDDLDGEAARLANIGFLNIMDMVQ